MPDKPGDVHLGVMMTALMVHFLLSLIYSPIGDYRGAIALGAPAGAIRPTATARTSSRKGEGAGRLYWYDDAGKHHEVPDYFRDMRTFQRDPV